MCGIVGYIGRAPCVELLFTGLQRLEYRGYDSAGIAVTHAGEMAYEKSEGKLVRLQEHLQKLPPAATRGIGHTRWATHGPPNTTNAHPHVNDRVALVHNGIIENYEELKAELEINGVRFQSDTDTEVVLELLTHELSNHSDPLQAIKAMVKRLQGAFSLGVMLVDDPDHMYLVKLGSPLVIGLGKGSNHFASDAMALIAHTNEAIFLNDGEIAKISETDLELFDFEGQALKPNVTQLELSAMSIEKQGYKHFMLKEIHEQPRVMASMVKTLSDIDAKQLRHDLLGLDTLDLKKIRSINMVACGTAYYSCKLGKYFLEPLVGLPVNVELASEFRYREPHLEGDTLVIAVSQSGETADTLACAKLGKSAGAQLLSICNVPMSSIPRESDFTLLMNAGPEIGVASTKAFTAMVLSQYLLALGWAEKLGRLSDERKQAAFKGLQVLPSLMEKALDVADVMEDLSNKYYEASDFLFIGRGYNFGIAMEGALKLKEISYIHAEGYAGGELKHGPIALIDRHMPVVAIAPRDQHYEKMLSNIEEVKAREGRIICVGDPSDEKLQRLASDYLPCPAIDDAALQSILSVVPLQLLSYYIAVKRGTDVDQPRNLAKSVTVE